MGFNTVNGLILLDPQSFNTTGSLNHNLQLDSSKLYASPATNLDAITGLKVSLNDTGYSIWVNNTHASNTLVLKHNNSGSDAGFRFVFPNGQDMWIAPGSAAQFEFITGTGWVPVFVNGRKRQETYSGTTNASGVYTVTFPQPYAAAPNIQANIVNQSATNQFLRVTSISATGFTVNVFARGSLNVLGIDVLLFTTTNVNGAAVDVLITEK